MLVPDGSDRLRLRLAVLILPAALVVLFLARRSALSPPPPRPEPAAVDAGRSGGEEGGKLPAVTLVAPGGVFRNPPSLFVWKPVPGASSYRLTITDQDMIWPLARREVDATQVFFPSSERRAWGQYRRYAWTVEAFGSGPGNVIAEGSGTFAIGDPDTGPAGAD